MAPANVRWLRRQRRLDGDELFGIENLLIPAVVAEQR